VRKHKIIVIVGFTDFGYLKKSKAEIHKYCIKVNAKVNYRRLNMRHIDSICEQRDEIEKHLNRPVSQLKLSESYLIYKFKVRRPILGSYLEHVKYINEWSNYCIGDGWKHMKPAEILINIDKYL
jgi:hypothetical protein